MKKGNMSSEGRENSIEIELRKSFDSIITVLSKLNDKKEIFDFLRDLLTKKEILEFSRRFEVAKMLEKNWSYTEIEQKTKMSSTTIARISKFLKWENYWYKNAISTLKAVSNKHHEAHHS